MSTCSKCRKKFSWLEVTKKDGSRGPAPVETECVEVTPLQPGERARDGEASKLGYTSAGVLVRGVAPVRAGSASVRIRESHFAHCANAQFFRSGGHRR